MRSFGRIASIAAVLLSLAGMASPAGPAVAFVMDGLDPDRPFGLEP